MDNKKEFYKDVWKLALPITIQCLLQSSFSIVDQIMVGSLGSVSIAGIGLGGKFSSLFITTVTAVSTAAGILIAQYYGNKDEKGVNESFVSSMLFSLIIAVLFTIPSMIIAQNIMKMYSKDVATINASASYLRIVSYGFIPLTFTLIMETLLRCIGYAKYPMYSSVLAVILNTVLNYILIFGKFGFSGMGLEGAAIATNISRIVEFVVILGFFIYVKQKENIYVSFNVHIKADFIKKVLVVLIPILFCEFLWSLGENIYSMIYGRIGTEACAAMTLTSSIQSLTIGAFNGVSAAAGIMVGRQLGAGDFDESYHTSKVFVYLGIIGSVIIGILVTLTAPLYVKLFAVSEDVRKTTCYILYAFSIILFVKVTNMILEGSVLRSGGNTKITLIIDFIGTWIFGIPLGLVTAFVFNMPIYYVYFILSLEEAVRMAISIVVFKKRIWMNNITNDASYKSSELGVEK